ncbi:MAG: decarboxylase [Deltaproteobacteria bacterium]|nr:decarboxylase [Deltaproteobacteria bacterium]
MRTMAEAVLGRVIGHVATLGEQPAGSPAQDGSELCRRLREGPPEAGTELGELLAPLFEEWIPCSFNTPGPGYLAFIPGGGLFPAALGDFVAAAVNRYTGVWRLAPALVQLEANVLDWFRQWLQMPPTTRGLLTSGGSLATFSAIVTARERLLGSRLRDGVMYCSTQAHHSIAKAARLAGILADRQRTIEADGRFRLCPGELEAAIRRDRAAGLRPFLVVSSAGTVTTGAIDPLDVVAEICAREGLWHHVDGAYGGFFFLCPELRPALRGLSRADSVVLDPHKGLFLPYGTGALLVRDGEALRQAHAASAGYLPALPEGEMYDPSQYGPELSRPYRGLGVWLPLKLFGAARFRAALSEKRELALLAAERLAAVPGIEIVAPPELSLFAFQLGRPGASPQERNAATRELIDRVVARGRIMLSGAMVGQKFLGRVCVLSFRTRRDRVEQGLEDLREETAEIVGRPGPLS